MNELENLYLAFESRRKPSHFTDFNHCEECRVHDETLRKFSRANISFKELGNLAWNPISFSTIDGFLYYLPALARLSLGQGDEYFADQFIIHVDNNERLQAMTKNEQKVLKTFMIAVREKLGDDFEFRADLEDWQSLIKRMD